MPAPSSRPARSSPGASRAAARGAVQGKATRKEKTRQAILAAAATCFGEHGFAACSMEQIAEGAGVTKPTLYAHFESKEGLFDALLRSTFEQAKEAPLPEVRSLAEVEEALLGLARAHLEGALREPGLGLYRAAAAEVMRRPAWARELARPAVRGASRPRGARAPRGELAAALDDDQLARWLAGLARAGLLDVPQPKLAAELFWSLVKGTLFYPVLLGLREVPTAREVSRVQKEAVRVFLDAHAPRGPREQA